VRFSISAAILRPNKETPKKRFSWIFSIFEKKFGHAAKNVEKCPK
jgi:hypothetical protein